MKYYNYNLIKHLNVKLFNEILNIINYILLMLFKIWTRLSQKSKKTSKLGISLHFIFNGRCFRFNLLRTVSNINMAVKNIFILKSKDFSSAIFYRV